jgi:hypothetical protein
MSNIIDERHLPLWIETNPLGNDFVRLLTALQRLTVILGQVLITECDHFPGCSYNVYTKNINQTIKILNRQELNLFSYENEQTQTRITFMNIKKTPNNNKTILIYDEKNNGRNYLIIDIL